MRLELQRDEQIVSDPFLDCLQQEIKGLAGMHPTVKGCPTLRVKIRRPSEHELSRCFLFPNLKPSDCALLTFELFYTTGAKHDLSYLPDGTLRAHHYAFEQDPEFQLYFDGGLPGLKGDPSHPGKYARTVADHIFKQLAH